MSEELHEKGFSTMSVELNLMDLAVGLEVGTFMEGVNLHDLENNWRDGVTFSANTVGSKIIGLFKVYDYIKINAKNYCKFLNKTFLRGPGYNQEALN